MKKVRIMLSAVVLMAVVGGALAFKAKTDDFCYYKKNTDGTLCTLNNTLSARTDIGAGDQTVIATPASGNCPSTQPLADCSRSFQTATN